MVTILNQRVILNVNYNSPLQCRHVFFINAGELDGLCIEIEHNLKEYQAKQNASGSAWRQRIERREEAWEVNCRAIFEHVVRNETLPEQNVMRSMHNVHACILSVSMM